MKKVLALALCAVLMVFLVACSGGGEKPDPKPGNTDTNTPSTDTGDVDITTSLWTLAYDEETWTLTEDDVTDEDDTCYATLQILNPDDPEYYLINVDIEAYLDEPYDFREDLVYYGFDAYEYAEENSYDVVTVGGVDCLEYENESWGETTLVYFNRVEGAGATVKVTVSAEDVTDSRVTELLDGLTFTLIDTGNEDGPWEWEGEPFAATGHSVPAGGFTLESEWVAFDEYIATTETFDHAVAAVGNTVYVLVDGALRQYTYAGDELTFDKDIELPEEGFDTLRATADGSLWLCGSMNDITVVKNGTVTAAYEDLDNIAVHESGTWGVSYFTSNECQKVTFTGDSYTTTDMVLDEVDSVMNLFVEGDSIYVCGSAADDSGHKVFVYNADGVLQTTLCDAEGEGLGSITYVTKTPNGYIGFDGNLRNIVLWKADGSYIAEVEDSDLFETNYPWFCASTKLDDGSILTVMTEERADRSAMELIAFNVSGF